MDNKSQQIQSLFNGKSTVKIQEQCTLAVELVSFPADIKNLKIRWTVEVTANGICRESEWICSVTEGHMMEYGRKWSKEYDTKQLTLKMTVEILEIYDGYGSRVPWKGRRHWPIYHVLASNRNIERRSNSYRRDEEDNEFVAMSRMMGDIDNLKKAVYGVEAMKAEIAALKAEVRRLKGHKGNVSMKTDNNMSVKQWLSEKVGLPQYSDLFVQNGYESLEFIKAITNKEQLSDIGIVLKGHQTVIMAKIQELNAL